MAAGQQAGIAETAVLVARCEWSHDAEFGTHFLLIHSLCEFSRLPCALPLCSSTSGS
jgi:hypothetical protein